MPENTPFDPRKHIINLKGKVYLETKYRIQWFRQDHPRGCINTEIVNYDPVVVRATVYDGEGSVLATAHAGAVDKGNAVWSGRIVEKSETAAIGRALGHAGYGTQFAGEGSTEDNRDGELADSPVNRRTARGQGDSGRYRGNDSAARRVRDMDAIYEATKTHFGARRHFDNLYASLRANGDVKDDWTDDKVIAAIHANRANEGKEDKGWYQNALAMTALNKALKERGTTLEKALARIGTTLDKAGSADAILSQWDALEDAERWDEQDREAFETIGK